MSRILHDAFDSTAAAASVTAASVASAQVSAASLSVVSHITATGVASAQISAATVEVTGEGIVSHHDAPTQRLYQVSTRAIVRPMPPKDPGEILDYTLSYASLLEDDETIAASSWSVTIGDDAITTGTGARAPTYGSESVTLWLSLGTGGTTYTITNHITTSYSPPREYERSFSLLVTDL